jgi:nucleoside-diphosphate-sugar epimerase
MKKIIIVTGAGGYIGTTLVPFLLKKGYYVRAIDRFFFGDNYLPKNKNLEIVREDIRRLKSNHLKNAYAVIDLAAISNDVTGERFIKETLQINYKARVNIAKLAKKNGIKRYILPSSCSNYGRIRNNQIADESFPTKPLTNYSKANSLAEKEVLALSTQKFIVTVLRQGTIYGYSPKMRFDLVVNRMTYDAWKYGTISLMKDGTQRRPALHIKDAISAMEMMLKIDNNKINNQIFNVGGDENNFMINDLAKQLQNYFKNKLKIKWYGSKDYRSYFVSFDKIKNLGFIAKYKPYDGIKQIIEKLDNAEIHLTPETITLDWYEQLEKWNKTISNLQINGNLMVIQNETKNKK